MILLLTARACVCASEYAAGNHSLAQTGETSENNPNELAHTLAHTHTQPAQLEISSSRSIASHRIVFIYLGYRYGAVCGACCAARMSRFLLFPGPCTHTQTDKPTHRHARTYTCANRRAQHRGIRFGSVRFECNCRTGGCEER